jgi:hypothetical protein
MDASRFTPQILETGQLRSAALEPVRECATATPPVTLSKTGRVRDISPNFLRLGTIALGAPWLSSARCSANR